MRNAAPVEGTSDEAFRNHKESKAEGKGVNITMSVCPEGHNCYGTSMTLPCFLNGRVRGTLSTVNWPESSANPEDPALSTKPWTSKFVIASEYFRHTVTLGRGMQRTSNL